MATAIQTDETRAQPIAAGLAAFMAVTALSAIAVWHADDLALAWSRAAALTFLVLTGPFLVLAHEFGHYAAAKLLGWRVPLLSWGSLTLRCSPLRLTVGRPAFGEGTAGAVVAVPPEGETRNWAWIFVFAGGPLANLVLAGLAGLVAFYAPPSSTAETLYLVFAVISLCSGLFNLWPRGGSDGGQILNILFARNAVRRGVQARLQEQAINRVRPRDWPPAVINSVLRDALWSNAGEAHLYAYFWHLDRGELAAARSALERAPVTEDVLVEKAFLCAYADGNAATARVLLAQTRSWSMHAQPCYWRAEAAAAVAEGDALRVRDAIRKGRILCREWPYATQFDADWFDELEGRI